MTTRQPFASSRKRLTGAANATGARRPVPGLGSAMKLARLLKPVVRRGGVILRHGGGVATCSGPVCFARAAHSVFLASCSPASQARPPHWRSRVERSYCGGAERSGEFAKRKIMHRGPES